MYDMYRIIGRKELSTFQKDTSICIELDHKHVLHTANGVLGAPLHQRNQGGISFQAYKLALRYLTLISSDKKLKISVSKDPYKRDLIQPVHSTHSEEEVLLKQSGVVTP
jgi:hypothetical protein